MQPQPPGFLIPGALYEENLAEWWQTNNLQPPILSAGKT
jgi:hypothetical protein